MFKEIKQVLFKAVGDKAYPEDDKKSDIVAYMRWCWIIIHIVTCFHICVNTWRHF